MVGVHELAEELIVRVCDRDVQIEEQEERIAAMEAEHCTSVDATQEFTTRCALTAAAVPIFFSRASSSLATATTV